MSYLCKSTRIVIYQIVLKFEILAPRYNSLQILAGKVFGHD